MTVALVQFKAAQFAQLTPLHTSQAVTLPATPTEGNELGFALVVDGSDPIAIPAGWTSRVLITDGRGFLVCTKVAGVSESPTVTVTFNPSRRSALVVWEVSGAYGSLVSGGTGGTATGNPHALTSVTPTAGSEALIIAAASANNAFGITSQPSGYTAVALDPADPLQGIVANDGGSDRLSLWTRHVAPASGSYSGDVSYGANVAFRNAQMWYSAIPSVDPDPPPFEPPEPAAALVEIYASVPGSSRWGTATWGNGLWSSAGWQDVTPQSVDAKISWGSRRPELGILSRPDAGAWTIATYDPDRLLDPSNADSIYATDLQPGLPIRITHRGVVIRQGTCDVISHAMASHTGLLRVIDNQSGLANTGVPPDTTLPDTLYARARAAIAACGLVVEVLPDPPAGDPALVPWETGTSWTAWQWISDAAEQVLHVPYIDRLGRLGFRAWAAPLARGRQLSSPELVDLIAIVDLAGLYSVVQARQTDGDGGDLIERRLTPPPAYGARVTTRNDPVLDPDAWADAVLADRAIGGLRWVPGAIRPLDAASTERLATIEAVELVTMLVPELDPTIGVNAIVVGGEISLTAKRDDAAVWAFRFEAAQAETLPLFADDEDPPAFLVAEDGDQYLYPG